ncbi:hypothetical protein AB6735_16755 [Mucilaginibacter sp. RCC_168]|uniref:hypothetical protein n=1 Tax=unclassified Mucilaginibacter TaxID=2617802 RepID=UPI00088D3EBD|nr:hypothetical protein [Mucilaginibacter sp. OK268]SDP12925.1 hypothetical protein SAMN05428975_0413 [Mucilaginibacter sp. OK268]
MTLVVSWIGMDSRKISSLNIASDSRISWGITATYDFGRKVFGCKNHPVIIGYCGDVLFPSIVINQLIDLSDQGFLFPAISTNDEKFDAFYQKLKELFADYPSQTIGIVDDTIQILFACRSGEIDFLCKKITWRKAGDSWSVGNQTFSEHSDKLFIIGSGRIEFEERFKEFQKSNEAKTSRAVFQCFCETLENITNNYVGGPPQLVGLYNRFNAMQFGIIHKNKRYFHGIEVNNSVDYNRVEWRNKLFEICDGETKKIRINAQKQPRAKRH